MASKLFLLLLIASATIAKSRWSLIELEDKDDHGEAEKDGNEKDLRVESERLAKYQNHGKKKGEAGAGKNSQKDYNASVSGGGAQPFISRFTGKAVKSF